jgi:predicted ATPase
MSDGTLKFLCLAAACFGPYPAPMIAFNEPESSLNPAVFEPLADILSHASQFSQLWLTTHSNELNQALGNRLACRPIRLDKVDGETIRAGRPKSLAFNAEEDLF